MLEPLKIDRRQRITPFGRLAAYLVTPGKGPFWLLTYSQCVAPTRATVNASLKLGAVAKPERPSAQAGGESRGKRALFQRPYAI